MRMSRERRDDNYEEELRGSENIRKKLKREGKRGKRKDKKESKI